MFLDQGLKVLPGDEAFYYRRENDNLVGMISTHVDDFSISGTKSFVQGIIRKIKGILTVSKVEWNCFRFTGIDVKKTARGIEMSMGEYADSLELIKNIRKGKKDELLTKVELKLYRKYTGKFNWLAENCRPDLAFVALQMAKKSNSATLGDLKKINVVIQRIKSKESKVCFKHVGRKEDLKVYGVGDASYRCDGKSIGGTIVLLGNKNTDDAVPLMWKSKTIKQVCHAAKDAETRNLVKLVDDSKYAADQIKILLFGDQKELCSIPVKLFTDSKTTLDSIASTKQIVTKLLRNSIQEFKDRLFDGEVESYSWLETHEMIADMLTKEMKSNEDVEELMLQSRFRQAFSCKNMVKYDQGEIRMFNLCNKLKQGRNVPAEIKDS